MIQRNVLAHRKRNLFAIETAPPRHQPQIELDSLTAQPFVRTSTIDTHTQSMMCLTVMPLGRSGVKPLERERLGKKVKVASVRMHMNEI